MAAKLTRLTHKIAIQLHLVAESCTICSSRSSRPVRKRLDTHSYFAENNMNKAISAFNMLRRNNITCSSHLTLILLVPLMHDGKFAEPVRLSSSLSTHPLPRNSAVDSTLWDSVHSGKMGFYYVTFCIYWRTQARNQKHIHITSIK
jgi:hypothetical protein